MKDVAKFSVSIAMLSAVVSFGACIAFPDLGAVCLDDSDCINSVCVRVPGELEGLCLDEDEQCSDFNEVTQDLAPLNESTITSFFPPSSRTCVRLVGDLILESPNLLSLDGMERLLEVTGDIRLRDNDNLVDISGLGHLRKVGGDFLIASNPLITAVELPRLYSVRSLEISGLSAMQDLDGLESLTVVGGSLNINANENLRSTEGLSSLLSIEGDLTVSGNASLETLAFDRLESIGGRVEIIQNQLLSQCAAQDFASDLGVSPLVTVIYENADSDTCISINAVAD